MKGLLIALLFLSIGYQTVLPASEAVIVNDKTEFIIKNKNKGIRKKSLTILVLTEGGNRHTTVNLVEDKYTTIKNLNVVIKDTSGRVLRELKEEDIIISNISSGGTFHSDDKRHKVDLSYNSFPYLVEIEYEIEINTLFLMSSHARWQPQTEIPVKRSEFSLIEEETVPYRCFNEGIAIEPTVSTEGNIKKSTWILNKIPPLKDKKLMPPEDLQKILLFFVPISFTIDNTAGSFRSWEDFGRWYYELIRKQDSYRLPATVMNEIHSLVDGITDPYVKINLLYNYLQDNTRYVAIELGIGSWIPYTAEWVCENRFGDCKDLSNFMIALLKEAGIRACPALIKMRNLGIIRPECPVSEFNHVITCIPFKTDTVWLECTSDYLTAGELPYVDEGCNVLLIGDQGGKLVKTPQSTANENVWNSILEGRISRNGSLNFTASITTSGKEKQYYSYLLKLTQSSEQEYSLKKYLCSNFVINQLANYQFIQSPEDNKSITINLSGEISNVGRSVGKRLFLNANIFNNLPRDLLDEKDSTRAILFNYPVTKTDNISISVPVSYKIEVKPENVNIESPYGYYHTQTEISGSKITYIRTLEIRERYISENRYQDFLAFYKKVGLVDTGNFIFVKR